MAQLTYAEHPEHCLCEVHGEFNIYSAQLLKDELLGLLQQSKPLRIDLSGVTDCDSAAVQVLLVLKREAHRQQRELRLVQHAPCIRAALELLNLSEQLDVQWPSASLEHTGVTL